MHSPGHERNIEIPPPGSRIQSTILANPRANAASGNTGHLEMVSHLTGASTTARARPRPRNRKRGRARARLRTAASERIYRANTALEASRDIGEGRRSGGAHLHGGVHRLALPRAILPAPARLLPHRWSWRPRARPTGGRHLESCRG
jgi:hypothetical protein